MNYGWYIHAWGRRSADGSKPRRRGPVADLRGSMHVDGAGPGEATGSTVPFTRHFKHRLCFRAVLRSQHNWTGSTARSHVPLGRQLPSPSVSGVRPGTRKGRRWVWGCSVNCKVPCPGPGGFSEARRTLGGGGRPVGHQGLQMWETLAPEPGPDRSGKVPQPEPRKRDPPAGLASCEVCPLL